MHVNEIVTFSLPNGKFTDIAVSQLLNRPTTMTFRPKWIKVTATGYGPGTTTTPGFATPIGMQIYLYDAGQNVVGVSRLTIATDRPATAFVKMPPSSDWWSYNTPLTRVVAAINAVCLGPTGGSEAFLRGFVVIGVSLKNEAVKATCPTMHSNISALGAAPLSISWAEEVDRDIPSTSAQADVESLCDSFVINIE